MVQGIPWFGAPGPRTLLPPPPLCSCRGAGIWGTWDPHPQESPGRVPTLLPGALGPAARAWGCPAWHGAACRIGPCGEHRRSPPAAPGWALVLVPLLHRPGSCPQAPWQVGGGGGGSPDSWVSCRPPPAPSPGTRSGPAGAFPRQGGLPGVGVPRGPLARAGSGRRGRGRGRRVRPGMLAEPQHLVCSWAPLPPKRGGGVRTPGSLLFQEEMGLGEGKEPGGLGSPVSPAGPSRTRPRGSRGGLHPCCPLSTFGCCFCCPTGVRGAPRPDATTRGSWGADQASSCAHGPVPSTVVRWPVAAVAGDSCGAGAAMPARGHRRAPARGEPGPFPPPLRTQHIKILSNLHFVSAALHEEVLKLYRRGDKL